MTVLVYIAIFLTVLYMFFGTWFYGTRNSLSKLGVDWNKWLFLLYMWAQALLVAPVMFDATPDNMQWIVFFVIIGLALTGGASIDNKDDLKYHYIGAAIACVFSVVWIILTNPFMLIIPVILVCSGGYDKIQWNGEVGIITAVYMTLLC